MKKCFLPIGVPEVPLDTDPQQSKWIDIYTFLYNERILFLFQILDDNFINQLLASLLFFNYDNSKKAIYFYINSLGGSLISGLALYDMINYINSEIVTLCIGITSSISSLILATGTKSKRLILPHSRILLQQPETRYYGQVSDVLIETEEILRLRQLLCRLYIQKTSQTMSKIAKDMDYDCFLSSREAKKYGIVDHILNC
uniref:ATP-dependent Clp protease proteolytic subunit n=1 Tax=Gymnochlora stellata TaxID=67809 RepID=A0A140JZI9_GYMST|nr:ATP-dependent Clp protease proteolytic subunit [Gymnochlora stellata]BAU62516.1 ATP-dependent Clp protease proteolytic subunit [Gymnochlora stellata]